MEQSPITPELDTSTLSFVTLDVIQAMRDTYSNSWYAHFQQARSALGHEDNLQDTVVHNNAIHRRAQQIAMQAYTAQVTALLDTHIPDSDQSEQYERLWMLFQETAPYAMTDEIWYLGASSNSDAYTITTETSGRAYVIDTLQALQSEPISLPGQEPEPEAEPPPKHEPEPPPDSQPVPAQPDEQPYIYIASPEVIEARNMRAQLSLARRLEVWGKGKKAQQRTRSYTDAQTAHQQALYDDQIIKIAQWRTQGLTAEQMQTRLASNVQDEHIAFTQAEATVLNQDTSRRARVARWLATKRRLIGFNIATGAAYGVGVSFLARGALGAVIGLSGGAVLVTLGALGTTRGILAANVTNRVGITRGIEARGTEDNHKLATALGGVALHDMPTTIGAQNNLLNDIINERIKRDQAANRKRVAIASAIGAASGLAALLVTQFIADHVHQTVSAIKPPGGHHATTPTMPKHHTHPPIRPPAATQPGMVNGYQTHVTIAHGEGYEQAMSELVAQKHIHLTGSSSWQLYLAVKDHIAHGNFFKHVRSYRMNNPGMWGISRPGPAQWRPQVVRIVSTWLKQHNYQ